VIRVYDAAGNVIETHEHKGDFKDPDARKKLDKRTGCGQIGNGEIVLDRVRHGKQKLRRRRENPISIPRVFRIR